MIGWFLAPFGRRNARDFCQCSWPKAPIQKEGLNGVSKDESLSKVRTKQLSQLEASIKIGILRRLGFCETLTF